MTEKEQKSTKESESEARIIDKESVRKYQIIVDEIIRREVEHNTVKKDIMSDFDSRMDLVLILEEHDFQREKLGLDEDCAKALKSTIISAFLRGYDSRIINYEDKIYEEYKKAQSDYHKKNSTYLG